MKYAAPDDRAVESLDCDIESRRCSPKSDWVEDYPGVNRLETFKLVLLAIGSYHLKAVG